MVVLLENLAILNLAKTVGSYVTSQIFTNLVTFKNLECKKAKSMFKILLATTLFK